MVNTSQSNYLAQLVIDNTGDPEQEKEHVDMIASVIGNLAQYLADFGS
jgi:SRSO17 transposase